jgi:hypothetical protein
MESFETTRLSPERLREGHLAELVALHLDPHVMCYVGGVARRSGRAPTSLRILNIGIDSGLAFGY